MSLIIAHAVKVSSPLAIHNHTIVRRACHEDDWSNSAGHILFYMAAGRGTPLSPRGSSAVDNGPSKSKGLCTIADSKQRRSLQRIQGDHIEELSVMLRT